MNGQDAGKKWGETLPLKAEVECRRISEEVTRAAQEREKAKHCPPPRTMDDIRAES